MWTILVMATMVVITHKRNCPNLAIGKRGLRLFTRRNNKSNNMKNELWTIYRSLLRGIMDDKSALGLQGL